MLESFIVVFRECVEAFLFVAIMYAYLAKTNRKDLLKYIYAGVVTAILISVTTAWHISELAAEPVWEGTLAMIAGALVFSFTIYVMKNAKNIGKDLNKQIEKQVNKEGVFAKIGVFLFTILMVSREGMEMALMLGTVSAYSDANEVLTGTGLALLCVGIFSFLWIKQSAYINLKLFMQVTGVFLALFALQLFVYGLHELSEMNAIPLIGEDMNIDFHVWSEPIESTLVTAITSIGLVGIPSIWLAYSYFSNKRKDLSI